MAITSVHVASEHDWSSPTWSEQLDSTFTYPPRYAVRTIAEQLAILRQIPELTDATCDPVRASFPLRHRHAEARFAIARWQAFGPTYADAVNRLLETIGSRRAFRGIEHRLTPDFLRLHARTAEAFRWLEQEQQGHQILIVDCQFGMRHRARSVRCARRKMDDLEFGLGSFAVPCMLLTHPEREDAREQLHVECPGDEIQDDIGGFSNAPLFVMTPRGVLKYGYDWFGNTYAHFGAATGFLPASARGTLTQT